MLKPVVTHEDKRRRLIEWISDTPVRRCKVIKVKDKKCFLGNHYHEKSDSIFYMLSGKAIFTTQLIKGSKRIERGWLFDEDCLFVPKGVAHKFEIFPNSILLEAASEPYDKGDEIPAEISLPQ